MPATSGCGLTVNNLGDRKICDSGDGGDGLVLCQVEGTHGEIPGVVVCHCESHVQAGHLVDLAWILQCQVVLQRGLELDACSLHVTQPFVLQLISGWLKMSMQYTNNGCCVQTSLCCSVVIIAHVHAATDFCR